MTGTTEIEDSVEQNTDSGDTEPYSENAWFDAAELEPAFEPALDFDNFVRGSAMRARHIGQPSLGRGFVSAHLGAQALPSIPLSCLSPGAALCGPAAKHTAREARGALNHARI